jgi:hypothetical protein
MSRKGNVEKSKKWGVLEARKERSIAVEHGSSVGYY